MTTRDPQSFLAALFSSVLWRGMGYAAGFAKHIIIAAAIGLTAQLDIFYMAMAVVGILVGTWAGAMEFIASPRLVREASKGNTRGFAKIAGGCFMLALAAGLLATALIIALRGYVAGLAPGFDAGQREALAGAFLWLIPVMLCIIPTAVLIAVLRARRHFGRAYQADALGALVVLACIVLAWRHEAVLLWSVSLGAVVAFCYAAVFAMRHIRMGVRAVDREVLGLFAIAPGLIMLYGTNAVFAVLDRIFASFLAVGSISALAYGFTLILVMPNLLSIPNAFMTVAAEKESKAARTAALNDLFSLVIILGAGATAFMTVAGADVIAVLFERGAFGAGDTGVVAVALGGFALMLIPLFALPPMDQIFQIEKRVGMMVRRSLVGVGVGLVLNYCAVFVFGLGVFGLALATAAGYWVIFLLGLGGLHRLGYGIAFTRHVKWAGWCIIAAGCGAGVALAIPGIGSFADAVVAGGSIGLALAVAAMVYPVRKSREQELLRGVWARLPVVGRLGGGGKIR